MRTQISPLLVTLLLAGAGPAASLGVGGRVSGPRGLPVEGARVLLMPMGTDAQGCRLELEGKTDPEPEATASTDADGVFRLEAPAAGMWKVAVQAPGLVPREILLVPLVEETELPLVRLDRDARLEVKVTGADGKPLPGARVRTAEPERTSAPEGWQAALRTALTDAKGVAVLPRVEGERLLVWAGMDGRPSVGTEVRSGSAALKLPVGGSRRIRVLDAAGTKPLPGIYVRAGEDGWCAGRTTSDGLFEVAVPAGRGRKEKVLLLAEDGRRLETFLEPSGPEEGTQILRISALKAVTGRVVSALDGRPLAGALVWGEEPGAHRRTGADGGYRLEQSGSGTGIRAAAPGHFPAAGRGPVLALEPAMAVAGLVVDERGQPVAGVEVRALPGVDAAGGGSLARTSSSGRFRLPSLAAGTAHRLRLSKAGFALASAEVPPLLPGRPAPDLRIVLRRGRTGFGRVVDRSEAPVAGARIDLRPEPGGDDASIFEAVTGADGRFEVPDLPPGSYELSARAAGYAPLSVPGLAVPAAAGSTDLGTLVLAPGVPVEGRVVDPQGQPVAGAEVRVAGDREESASAPPATTGADGSFRIEDRRAGERLQLEARRAGYVPATVPGIQVPPGRPVRIVLQPSSAVEGRVVNPDGEPVPGARVLVTPAGPAAPGAGGQARSDESGAFRIEDVPPGAIELQAQAPGHQGARLSDLEVRPGQDLQGVEVVLAPGSVIEGRVLSASGRPVMDAEVGVVELEPARGSLLPLAVRTDREGRYRLEGVAPGLRTIRAAHGRHRPGVRQLEVRPGGNALDLTLEEGLEIRGRVVDEAGSPVAGARISLREGGQSQDLPSGTTGPDGSFILSGLADGTYRLLAEKEGFASDPDGREVTVAGSSLTGIEIELAAGGAIVGQLLGLDFTELSQVQVRAGPRTGTVLPDGSYRIDHVAPGTRHVVASLPGGSRQAEGQVTLEPGASEARLDLDFGEGLTLTGRVERNGEPVPGETVVLGGASRRWAQTGHDGRFRFEGLASGHYELIVVARGGGARYREEIDVTADRDVLIELRTVSVSGRVLDGADQSPLAGATVALVSPQGGEEGMQATTDSRGLFRLGDVSEGSWKLRASLPGYAPAEVDFQAGGAPVEGLELALEATEGLILEVLLPSGRPPALVRTAVLDTMGRVAAVASYPVGEGGRLRIPGLAPGDWELILDADGSAPLALTVKAPGNAGRVVLPQPGALSLRVPELAAAPAGARVRLNDAAGRPFRSLLGSQVLSELDLEGGSRDFQRLPSGPWWITITADDGRTWRGYAVVPPGGTATVKLD